MEQISEQTVNSCQALCLLRKGSSNKKVQCLNELSILQEGVQGSWGDKQDPNQTYISFEVDMLTG